MARSTRDRGLLELAKLGAQAQLNDLVHEVKMLFELFPHLRDSVDPDELSLLFFLKQASAKALRKSAPGSITKAKAARQAPPAAAKKTRRKTPTKA